MKRWAMLLAAGLLALTPAHAREADARFTQTLTATELVDTGLKRLSSDQIAVIDALVRRDLAKQGDTASTKTFSQRLTDDERKVAGLTVLSEVELAKFDLLVARHAAAIRTRELLGPPVLLAASPRLRESDTDMKTKPEIHGSFSLSMGWGSGGYSEKTGAMNLNYTDPVRGFSVSVGYSETHLKGPSYIYRDPLAVPPPLAP